MAGVLHPALPGCPDHELWRRDYSGACGLFSFVFRPAPEVAVNAFLDALDLFGLGFSWGGFESLAISCDPQLGTRKFRHGNDDQRRKALASARPGAVDAASATPAVEFPDLAALAARDLPPTSDLADDMFPPFDMSPPLTAPETD